MDNILFKLYKRYPNRVAQSTQLFSVVGRRTESPLKFENVGWY